MGPHRGVASRVQLAPTLAEHADNVILALPVHVCNGRADKVILRCASENVRLESLMLFLQHSVSCWSCAWWTDLVPRHFEHYLLINSNCFSQAIDNSLATVAA